MADIRTLDEIVYEIYRQSRLKEDGLPHKPYREVNSQAIAELEQLIKEGERLARIDELEATSYTEMSSTSKGEIRPGAGFNLIPNRLKELREGGE